MIKLLEFAGSDILYHITNVYKTASIFELNRFQLTANAGTETEQGLSSGKSYYLSCARTPTSSYIKRETMDKLIVIMRKNGLTVKRFIERLKDKWHPPYK